MIPNRYSNSGVRLWFGNVNGGNERDLNPHLPLARRGLSQLSYRPGRERAAAQAATPRKWRLKLVTIQPVRVFGRAIIRSAIQLR